MTSTGTRSGTEPVSGTARNGTLPHASKTVLADENENIELRQSIRELQTFAEIASTMQTTVDVADVQERVVVGLTDRLGFARAVVGVCDPSERYVKSTGNDGRLRVLDIAELISMACEYPNGG